MQRIEISDLFHDPHYYLFGFDGDDALFLRLNRECYARSIFFDDRIVTLDDQLIRVPVAALQDAAAYSAGAGPRPGWIFHMAHTGSTLLSRALDRTGISLGIREPKTLRALGVAAGAARAAAPPSQAWDARLKLAVAMLGRRFADDEAVIVKANVPVNAMLPDLLGAAGPSNAVLLHFGLADYLTAILRSANHRKWVDFIFAELQLGALPEVGQAPSMTTAEKAAALWLFQIRAFVDALAANPAIRSLDANILFDEPLVCVKAASGYFGSPMTDDAAREIVNGPLFSTYSKNPNAAFDNGHRKLRVAETRSALADELRVASAWIAPRVAVLQLPERLSRPLCGENPALLSE